MKLHFVTKYSRLYLKKKQCLGLYSIRMDHMSVQKTWYSWEIWVIAYIILVRSPQVMKTLWNSRRRWEHNFQMNINRLTPNDPYMGRTSPLTSKRCILYIYSTNIGNEYFNPLNAKLNPIYNLLALLGTHPILHVSRVRVKHALYFPFFFLFKMQFVSQC